MIYHSEIEAQAALKKLFGFIAPAQFDAIAAGFTCKVPQFYYNQAVCQAAVIAAMPEKVEPNKSSDDAIVKLHYSEGQRQYYVTELGILPNRHLAFGLIHIGPKFRPIVGYISLPMILKGGAELDFYWSPVTVERVRERIFLDRLG